MEIEQKEAYTLDLAGNTSPNVDENQKNKLMVLCMWCGEKIFRPGAAKLVEKEFFLHSTSTSSPTEGDTCSAHWHVTDQYDFENVGVTKPITGAGAAHPSVPEGEDYRYLSCATCDRGPLGIYFPTRNPREFYVAHDRIKYQE
eukprot:132933_1